MRVLLVVALFALVVVCSAAEAQTQGPEKVLVLVDSLVVKSTHASYLADLEALGFDVSVARATDSNLKLHEYGVPLYDHVILFAPKVDQFGGTVTVDSVLDYVDSGRSVVLVAAPSMGSAIRELASEFGVSFGRSGSFVADHFNVATADDGSHTTFVADDVAQVEPLTGKLPKNAAVLFQGAGHTLDEPSSRLHLPVVRAPATAFRAKPGKRAVGEPDELGSHVVLVSAIQARNNARILVSGSLDFFSDAFFGASLDRLVGDAKDNANVNQALATTLTAWTLGARGTLRVRDVSHRKPGETVAPAAYRIKDELEASVVLEEKVNGEWVGFATDQLVLSAIMLDPYVRTTMTHEGDGVYRSIIQMPDQIGIFTIQWTLFQQGYSFVHEKRLTPLHAFAHNDYDRFLVAAYPYYASAFSMIGGVVLIAFIFLLTKDKPQA